MKKTAGFVFILSILLGMTGCSDTTTNVQTIPQVTLERYLDSYNVMRAVTEVSGTNYDNVTVYFRNSSGTTVGSVTLNEKNPSAENLYFSSGLQKMNLYYASMTEPTWYVPGTVHIECDYTDALGSGNYIFNGLIAAWTLN